MTLASLGPLLDAMMNDLGVPLRHGGVIMAALFAGTATGVVLLNTVMARWTAKWTMCAAAGVLGAGLVTGGLAAHSLRTLCLAIFVAGLTSGLLFNVCFTWLSTHIRRNQAGSTLVLIAFSGLAVMIVPMIVGHALDAGATWRQVMLLEGAFTLLCSVIFAFLPLLDMPGNPATDGMHVDHGSLLCSYGFRALPGRSAWHGGGSRSGSLSLLRTHQQLQSLLPRVAIRRGSVALRAVRGSGGHSSAVRPRTGCERFRPLPASFLPS